MLNQGSTLENIEYWCRFRWNLSKEQKNITKDNCFIISHWQCCEKPAYRIVKIEKGGYCIYCLICEPLVILQEQELDENEGLFYQYYICPKCGEKHVCVSQSGDMVHENLDLCE